MKRTSKGRRRLSYENRLTWLAFGAAVPGGVIALAILWSGDFSAKVQWTLTLAIVGCFLGFILSARDHLVRPLQTMTNLLAALREGDYSIRARGARENDALGEAFLEVNLLGETLRLQRLGAFEATALLRTIMAEIDVAVFTFDGAQKLRLTNRAGERLLARPSERLLNCSAGELGLSDCLQGEASRTMEIMLPGGSGRWGLRRTIFREHGMPHTLLVLTDLSRALREEERAAWQRLVRVLAHELNNSLAPIKSIAGTMNGLLKRQPRSEDWEQDMQRGLEVISNRAVRS